MVMTAAKPIVVQVDNTGTAATTAITTTITGADAADYSETNTCTTLPEGSEGGGGSCNVTINFTPTAAGPRLATLTVSANGAGRRILHHIHTAHGGWHSRHPANPVHPNPAQPLRRCRNTMRRCHHRRRAPQRPSAT